MVKYLKELKYPIYKQDYGADLVTIVGVNDMDDVNNIINALVNRGFTFAIQRVDQRSTKGVLILDEKWYGPQANKNKGQTSHGSD